jgi:hypothetical protein
VYPMNLRDERPLVGKPGIGRLLICPPPNLCAFASLREIFLSGCQGFTAGVRPPSCLFSVCYLLFAIQRTQMKWDELYQSGDTPWEKGAPAPPLLEW